MRLVRDYFIIPLRLIGHVGKETSVSLVGCTVKYGPQN